MAKERFKYRDKGRKVEDVVRRSRQSSGAYDSYLIQDVTFFKPREGDNTVRILPRTWDDTAKWGDNWEIQLQLHRNVGPDDGTYLCLDKMRGEQCPVCEARRDAADEDEADLLKPQWRAICWVIDRDNEKAGPQIWSIPVSLFRDINTRSVDKKSGGAILIDEPDDGYDLMFTREGEKKRTKYTAVDVDRDPSPIHDDQKKQDKWLEYIEALPLPDVLQFYPAEHIEKVLFGKADRKKRDDDEEEDRPARRRSRAEPEEEEDRPRRRGRAEPESEEDGETPRGRQARRGKLEADEDEEEERPRRRRTEPEEEPEEKPRSRRRSEPEPEEDEDPPPRSRRRVEPEPEEEEPEEKPRSRRRAEPEEEEEVEEVEEKPSRSRRRAEPEPEEDEDDPSPSKQARGKLERLKSRSK